MQVPATYTLLLTVTAAEALTLAVLVWRRHASKRGAVWFLLLMISVSVWTAGYAIELISPGLEDKLLWAKVQYLGIVATPVLTLLFSIDHTGRPSWLTPRNLILVSVIPLTTVLLMWTNEVHGLMYADAMLDTSAGFPNLRPSYGKWFWVHLGYSYFCMVFASALLIRALIHSPRLYRSQAGAMLAAAIAPWLGNLAYLTQLNPFPGLDLTPFAFAFTGVMLGWNLVRFRLFAIIPAAREAVIESMSDAVVVLDGENRVVDLNPAARQLIRPRAEGIVGRTLVELLPEQRELIERFRETTQAETEINVSVEGAQRIFDLRLSALRDRRSDLTGRLIVLRDVTDRRKGEREIERAHAHALEALRVKSRILAIVSHDFRTPLSAIVGYADMLLNGVQGPVTDAQKGILARINANAQQLSNLVTDLLDQAELDNSGITLNLMKFPPSAILDAVETTMTPRAQQKGLKLTLLTALDSGAMLYGDVRRVLQVVNNIVDNALKFTEKGTVLVRVHQPDAETWGIEVIDTGPGIPQEALAHIFDPFWQADGTVTREHGGVGLGLSISKQLVSLMGGRVEVQSKVGHGTRFNVVFPLKSAKEQQREEAAGVSH